MFEFLCLSKKKKQHNFVCERLQMISCELFYRKGSDNDFFDLFYMGAGISVF